MGAEAEGEGTATCLCVARRRRQVRFHLCCGTSEHAISTCAASACEHKGRTMSALMKPVLKAHPLGGRSNV